MENDSTTRSSAASPVATSAWKATQVYAMAVISLVVGLALGYLFRGSQSPAPAAPPVAVVEPASPASPHTGAMGAGGKMPSLDEMKQMAEKKAVPLLEKLKTDPTNKDLLIQVAKIYSATHQFKEAAVYYDRAVQVDPKDVPLRTQLASTLYFNGDIDGAISQLQQSLRQDPKDANSLFNLGMIEWQGKKDGKGALATWQLLLKSNPQLKADQKATVQKLMADVQMQGKS
jgi:cytochrome c-type biogenesis protein CcmH/NrfG